MKGIVDVIYADGSEKSFSREPDLTNAIYAEHSWWEQDGDGWIRHIERVSLSFAPKD